MLTIRRESVMQKTECSRRCFVFQTINSRNYQALKRMNVAALSARRQAVKEFFHCSSAAKRTSCSGGLFACFSQ